MTEHNTPYFACDAGNMAQLRASLPSQKAGAQQAIGHWVALVDTAFDADRAGLRWEAGAVRLYSSGRWAPLGSVSPVLLALPPTSGPALAGCVARLIAHAQGRPMLSLLRTMLSLEQLAQAFQSTLDVTTPDSQTLLLRWADTRVSATLPAILQPAHWALVTRGVLEWWVIDRQGQWLSLPVAPAPGPQWNAAPPGMRIELSETELARLTTACMPDALADALNTHFAELLPDTARAQLHAQLSALCDLCAEPQDLPFQDLLVLAVATLSTQGRLLQRADLKPWLAARAWPPAEFADALADFMGEGSP